MQIPSSGKGSVLCVLCYETKAEENTWNSEAGVGGRDVAVTAYKIQTRFIEVFADLPLGAACYGCEPPADHGNMQHTPSMAPNTHPQDSAFWHQAVNPYTALHWLCTCRWDHLPSRALTTLCSGTYRYGAKCPLTQSFSGGSHQPLNLQNSSPAEALPPPVSQDTKSRPGSQSQLFSAYGTAQVSTAAGKMDVAAKGEG